MAAVVDAAEAPRVDVAVDLRRREGAVPEQLLDRAQVGAALEQVGRERVPQAMRVRAEAAQRRGVEPPAAGREEERVAGAAGELRPRPAQVARDPERRLLAERYDAVLRALAGADVDELLLEVDVAEVEPDRLGGAQAGRVDEFDERAVAEGERAVALEAGERPLDLVPSRRVRQPPRASCGRASRR